jgi:hypothetical protein
MGSQGAQNISLRPPVEFSLRQTFVTEPKSLAIVAQNSHGRAPPISEYEQGSTQRIASKPAAANRAKPVDPSSEVHWIHRQKDAHLRGDLDHGRLQNALAIAIRWSSTAPRTLMRRKIAPSG